MRYKNKTCLLRNRTYQEIEIVNGLSLFLKLMFESSIYLKCRINR